MSACTVLIRTGDRGPRRSAGAPRRRADRRGLDARRTKSRLTQGLTRLRLEAAEVEPELVGRSQVPLAGAAGRARRPRRRRPARSRPTIAEAATFLVLSLNTASITSFTLGNDVGVRQPDPMELARFCLQGLGAQPEPTWFAAVNDRLHLKLRPRGRRERPR